MPIPLGILAVAGAGAAGAASSFDLLETVLITTNTASVTFSNLGTYSNYKHLQIRAVHRGSHASVFSGLDLTINGDTGANYARHALSADGSTVEALAAANTSNIPSLVGNAASETANIYGVAVIDILDFSSTSKNKTIRSLTGTSGVSYKQIRLMSGFRNNTAAITSLTLTPFENIVSGSRFSLYGVK